MDSLIVKVLHEGGIHSLHPGYTVLKFFQGFFRDQFLRFRRVSHLRVYVSEILSELRNFLIQV